ncbi:MAG: NAD(P)-dependent alcohol dehydrogenase [Pseudomonadota bacterium]
MRIRAAVLEKPGAELRLRELELAAPGDGELIVEISSCGICHTDIGVQAMVPLPAVLGHEGTGIVVQRGPGVRSLSAGDRVALTFGSCGCCRNCRAGMPSHCFDAVALNFSGLSSSGTTTMRDDEGCAVHGSFFSQSSFASHALVNERNAVRIADDIPHRYLGPLGCGVQTGAGAVLNTLDVPAGSSIVCIGVGAVGLSAVMAAGIRGCREIIAIDTRRARLDLATELGATHTCLASAGMVGEVLEITSGGADFSLDTAGTVDTFHAAIACLRMGGHAGLASVPNWQDGFHFMPSQLALGRTVTGVLEGSSRPQAFIPELCRHFLAGRLPVDRLVQTYPFSGINRALDDLHHGRVVKPVLLMK